MGFIEWDRWMALIITFRFLLPQVIDFLVDFPLQSSTCWHGKIFFSHEDLSLQWRDEDDMKVE